MYPDQWVKGMDMSKDLRQMDESAHVHNLPGTHPCEYLEDNGDECLDECARRILLDQYA